MSDQMALGLLAQIVQQHKEMIDLLAERVEALEDALTQDDGPAGPATLDG